MNKAFGKKDLRDGDVVEFKTSTTKFTIIGEYFVSNNSFCSMKDLGDNHLFGEDGTERVRIDKVWRSRIEGTPLPISNAGEGYLIYDVFKLRDEIKLPAVGSIWSLNSGVQLAGFYKVISIRGYAVTAQLVGNFGDDSVVFGVDGNPYTENIHASNFLNECKVVPLGLHNIARALPITAVVKDVYTTLVSFQGGDCTVVYDSDGNPFTAKDLADRCLTTKSTVFGTIMRKD